MGVLVHSTGFYQYPKPWEQRQPVRAIKKHLKYIESDRKNKKGIKVHREPPIMFSKDSDKADRLEFGRRIAAQKEQGVVAHKLVISMSEDEQKRLGINMIEFVRETMAQYETARKQQLDWIAAYHNDEDHPHCHIVIRGRDERERSVYISNPQMRQMERIGERVKERLAERNRERGRYIEEDWKKQLDRERELLDKVYELEKTRSFERER
ncbi:relaxase/mobilization nuclease domain-containing protein [Thermoactinomyces daqus]|uniref:Relaxase/mobilization nuclease domain-containing protein n=1 Tax=Thermoactinomyces daqus TaxID=1329516 RepID=A0A7W2AJW2_9BACL|nr:relaxase/mobilization nuclease domain-containing protein [Thermoactinomyces daqus]MBA4544288.1 relaxase/mobilization nuclease domain-containing protein [Thermoactinomyces daqus]